MEYFLTVVIACAISLVMVAFSRQLDKGNRSLEKVKRYADYIKEDLESFSAEKIAMLKDAAIELNVKQEQAIASVKKMDHLYDQFMKKSTALAAANMAVEKIHREVQASEKDVCTLREQVAVAQGLIAEVNKESSFVDSLSKRVAAAKTQLQQVSAAIPDMQNAFTRENTALLHRVRDGVLADVHKELAVLQTRLEKAQGESQSLFEVSAVKLRELYEGAFSEATVRAQVLEENGFGQLKVQAENRLLQLQEEFEGSLLSLQQHVMQRVEQTDQHIQDCASQWSVRAQTCESDLSIRLADVTACVDESVAQLKEQITTQEREVRAHLEGIEQSLSGAESGLRERVHKSVTSFHENLNKIAEASDAQLQQYRKEMDGRCSKFDRELEGIDVLESQLQLARERTEQKVREEFEAYAQDRERKQLAFEAQLQHSMDTVEHRMKQLNDELRELKASAYANASEKLQSVEDNFFEVLTKRSDSLHARFSEWSEGIEGRLTQLALESESARKDLEDTYRKELHTRLKDFVEEYKGQCTKLGEQILAIESNVKQHMRANDDLFQRHTEKFTIDVAALHDKAHNLIERELEAVRQRLRDSLHVHSSMIETEVRDMNVLVQEIKQEAQGGCGSVKRDIEAWKAHTDKQFADAKQLFEGKIAHLVNLSERAIENLSARYDMQYEDFSQKNGESLQSLRDEIGKMCDTMRTVKEELGGYVNTVTGQLHADGRRESEALHKTVKEARAQVDRTLQETRDLVQDLRAEFGEAQVGLLTKLQGESDRFSQVLQEIERKQHEFIGQTRIFDRADELRENLEKDIERLTETVTRFEVYREAMDKLSLQYEKVKHFGEEAEQRVEKFMQERKNIDLLEGEFSKLAALSDAMDKKIVELTLANDDLQRYQVQIRKVKEGLGDISTRYERLDKKGAVLDQTVQDVDRAFENLKELEKTLKNFRGELETVDPQLQRVRAEIAVLLDNQEKAERVRSRIECADALLGEMESRIEKMQHAREWLAGTETRLQEISKVSEGQLRLLGDLMRQDPANKIPGAGAPPLATRQNVVKLHKSG